MSSQETVTNASSAREELVAAFTSEYETALDDMAKHARYSQHDHISCPRGEDTPSESCMKAKGAALRALMMRARVEGEEAFQIFDQQGVTNHPLLTSQFRQAHEHIKDAPRLDWEAYMTLYLPSVSSAYTAFRKDSMSEIANMISHISDEAIAVKVLDDIRNKYHKDTGVSIRVGKPCGKTVEHANSVLNECGIELPVWSYFQKAREREKSGTDSRQSQA